jgi:hypothetical protein
LFANTGRPHRNAGQFDVEFRQQSRRICPRRISKCDKTDKFQRIRWPGGNGERSISSVRERIQLLRSFSCKRRKSGDCRRRAFYDPELMTLVDRSRFGHFGRRIERLEARRDKSVLMLPFWHGREVPVTDDGRCAGEGVGGSWDKTELAVPMLSWRTENQA